MDVKLIIRQAIQWQQKGNLKQAIELYQQVLSNHSQHETAMVNLGVALFHGKQYQEAFAQLHRAAQIHPESAHANFNLGYAFLQVKKIREAVSHFEKTVQLNPNFFQAQLYLANAYESLSLLEKAFERYHIAYRLQSNHLELLNNWAKLCIGLKKFAQADKILEKALMLYPQRAELYGNQATVQKELGKMQQAEASFKTAITLNPQDWRFYNALGTLYHTCNRYQEALIYLKKALELDSTNAKVHSNIVYLQNYFPEYSNIYHLKAHQEWQKRHASLLLKLQKSYCYSSGLPLKIGLLSGDFHGHPVAVFLLAWLKYVNRAKMEFHAYTEIRHRDATTEKIKKECTNWFETNTLSDREVADKIHSDGIHILMDLAGHTRGNRLAVMAYQAAPIQISYLGYINTTGLPQIDYRLADRYVNPPESQAFYTEKLLYLPNSYTCYSPPDIPDLEVQHTPALKNRYLTFGSFNNPSKYNPEVFQLWAELLRCFPDSKLLLKARHFGTKEG